jgi:hypothetical protein
MTNERLSGPTLRWGWLATGLAIFSAACLATLIVVVAVKNIDTLSTVALALAVLAFSAQLIVTLVQGQQFGQLNADTKSALTEIRATTSSLLTNQRELVNRVLEYAFHAFQTAVPAAVEDVTGDEQQSTDQSERAAELESALQTRVEESFKEAWDTISKDILVSPEPARLTLRTDRPDVVWSSDVPPANAK